MDWARLAAIAAEHGVPLERLGLTGGDRLRIELVGEGATGAAEERGADIADPIEVELASLRHAWAVGAARHVRERVARCAASSASRRPAKRRRRSAALGLFALQHRGQESAGLAVSDGRQVMVYKDLGLVAQVLDERRLPSLQGEMAIAHCRYSTTGSTRWENAQPSFRLGPRRTVAMGHNGNLVNTRQLLELLPGGRSRMARLDRHRAADRAAGRRARRRPRWPRCCGCCRESRARIRWWSWTSSAWSAYAIRTASGRWSWAAAGAGGWVLASETAALDILERAVRARRRARRDRGHRARTARAASGSRRAS